MFRKMISDSVVASFNGIRLYIVSRERVANFGTDVADFSFRLFNYGISVSTSGIRMFNYGTGISTSSIGVSIFGTHVSNSGIHLPYVHDYSLPAGSAA